MGLKPRSPNSQLRDGMGVKIKYYVHNLLRKPAAGAKEEARAVGWGNREARDLLWLKGSDVCIGFCRVYGRLWARMFQVEGMA